LQYKFVYVCKWYCSIVSPVHIIQKLSRSPPQEKTQNMYMYFLILKLLKSHFSNIFNRGLPYLFSETHFCHICPPRNFAKCFLVFCTHIEFCNEALLGDRAWKTGLSLSFCCQGYDLWNQCTHFRICKIRQSCQTWPAKFGQIFLRTNTILLFSKLMRTDTKTNFFNRTTKTLCNFVNPDL